MSSSSKPQLLASKCESVQHTAKEALGKQHFAGFVAVDSRHLTLDNFQSFLMILKEPIKNIAIPGVDKMSFSCHLLYAFLEDVVEAKAISLGSLQGLVSHHDALSPFSKLATCLLPV